MDSEVYFFKFVYEWVFGGDVEEVRDIIFIIDVIEVVDDVGVKVGWFFEVW